MIRNDEFVKWLENKPIRAAWVGGNAETVKPYLYSNYQVADERDGKTLIHGADIAGFTLDAILDRMASGLIFGKEVTG